MCALKGIHYHLFYETFYEKLEKNFKKVGHFLIKNFLKWFYKCMSLYIY